MPRTARSVAPGLVYHVYNRGNGRLRLFHNREDYQAFEQVLIEGLERHPDVQLLAYCLMPDHWHMLLRPRNAKAMGRFLGAVAVTHVRRHRERHHSQGEGHLYQGRYKSFPVAEDEHFLTLCQHLEGNARRKKLVRRAEAWPFSSLARRQQGREDLPLAQWPVKRPSDWARRVNEGLSEPDLAAVRLCVKRGRPWGSPQWVLKTAKRLNLMFTLRGRGRPPKHRPPEMAMQ